jgi:hypothetical protein
MYNNFSPFFYIFKHNLDNERIIDQSYIDKRIANTKSVHLHRKQNPKIKFEELSSDTITAYREAKLFEEFLNNKLGLRITGIDEIIKDYDKNFKNFIK